MNPVISQLLEPGRRTLAAIVFTDVASFSARMQEAEEATLALVRRDLSAISSLSTGFDGKVLKNTGDGLLIYFESAVQAVACALKVQQELAEKGKTLPPEERLLHRIGIHLGDVFVTETDVMGDGVNIAARLQTEAEPGGICISQTVFDVVKNRLALQTVYLGPRELKNIRDAVPVYQVLVNAQQAGAAPGISTTVLRRRRISPMLWAGAGAAAVFLVLGVVLLHGRQKPSAKPETTAVTASQPPAVPTAPKVPETPDTGSDKLMWPPALPEPGGTGAARMDPATLKTVDDARLYYLQTRRYSGMMRWLEQHNQGNTPTYTNFSLLAEGKAQLQARLAVSSREKPWAVGSALSAWKEPDGAICVTGKGGEQKFLMDLLPLDFFCAMLAGAVRDENIRSDELLPKLHALQKALTDEFQAAGLGPPPSLL